MRQRRMDGAVVMKTSVHGSKCAACLSVVFEISFYETRD
jgi:hypothetical protein